MRILLLSADYSAFLSWLYAHHVGLDKQPYEVQMRARVESLFGVADFYSSNLRKLGHEAYDIYPNNYFMQSAWAREHGVKVEEPTQAEQVTKRLLLHTAAIAAKTPLRYLKPVLRPIGRALISQEGWYHAILAAQIKYYRPDVLLNQAMDEISSRFLQEMKPYTRLLVGQIASPLPEGEDFGCYDLVVSSLPNFVDHFRRLGIASELNRLAFEPRVLSKLSGQTRDLDVTFVGSVSRFHEARLELLEHVCANQDIRIWGHGADRLPDDSPVRAHHEGPAWGIRMFEILRASKITLNHHIGIASSCANNQRLFEATGVGTLLITDWKANLYEMFEPGREVITYRSPEECSELIQYYLEHDEEREEVARAGQERTTREHNYARRVRELVDIVCNYL